MTKRTMKKTLDSVVKGAQAFSDKGRQVEPSSLTAFGIELSSRYGKAYELEEMLAFARQPNLACVAHYVRSVSYDSKATCCAFELDECVKEGTEIETELRAVAQRTITQFLWFDDVLYKNGDPGA